jgi:CheY-like chemotaxis protein
VAEDSLVSQKLVVCLLERQGHWVTVVSNGKEALAALERDRFDVVLMDIDMPEMDGLSATRMIRAGERRNGNRLPIVAVTSRDNRQECLNAGMDAYLPKPLKPDQLNRTLDKVSGRTAA